MCPCHGTEEETFTGLKIHESTQPCPRLRATTDPNPRVRALGDRRTTHRIKGHYLRSVRTDLFQEPVHGCSMISDRRARQGRVTNLAAIPFFSDAHPVIVVPAAAYPPLDPIRVGIVRFGSAFTGNVCSYSRHFAVL